MTDTLKQVLTNTIPPQLYACKDFQQRLAVWGCALLASE